MGCGGFTCSKNALAALNVLYILVAFILIGVAAYGKAVAIITSISIMGGIIACGVFLLLVAIIGLVGAIKHHQVLLFFYMIILFMLFLVQFAVACACLAVNSDQQEALATSGWNQSTVEIKRKVQRFFNCCGFDYYSQDWTEDQPGGHPPCKEALCCSNHEDEYCCSMEYINSTNNSMTTQQNNCSCTPCWNVIHVHMNQALKIAGFIGLFFSFTEIIGIWLALRYRNQKDPRANPSAFL